MSYQNKDIAQDYLAFTNSENGRVQQDVLFTALSKYLDIEPQPTGPKKELLDVACGGGWLAGRLAGSFKVSACDFSTELISHAKTHHPNVNFTIADLNQKLPYQAEQFDTVIFNMAAHDVAKLANAFAEISRVTKNHGQVLVTIANPYYAFPVGVWKRGLLGFILRQKPRLLLRPYQFFKRRLTRQFIWNDKFTSYFYTLPEYIEQAGKAQLQLTALEDLGSPTDSATFNMRYQLFRFPITQLLVFKKTLE